MAMRVQNAINIDDLRRAAQRHMPKVVYDFVEGGCDDEQGIRHNADFLSRYKLTPRYGVDVSPPDTSAQIFGRTYAAPIGIAPTGLAGLFRPGAELMFARAAAAANIPYAMSVMSSATLESAVALAPENLWFQVYGCKDRDLLRDLLRRARDVGVTTLAFTMDCPVLANRERNTRNGFGGRMPLPIWLESLTHPAWIWDYIRTGGTPVLENFVQYTANKDRAEATAFSYSQIPSSNQTWDDVKMLRDNWPGALVVKGLQHPHDAVQAVKAGADGIWVSNHGGRQLDRAPSPMETLQPIRAAVGPKPRLIVDGGISRGADVVLARCLGADLAFMGRTAVYGAAAGGPAGVAKALEIMQREVRNLLVQLGCPRLEDLGPDMLFDSQRGEFWGR